MKTSLLKNGKTIQRFVRWLVFVAFRMRALISLLYGIILP